MTPLIIPIASHPACAVPPAAPTTLATPAANLMSETAEPIAADGLPTPAAFAGFSADITPDTPPCVTPDTPPLVPAVSTEPAACTKPAAFGGPLAVGISSKIGPRSQNDDFAGFGRNHEVFAVADGIGGAPRGDVAATVAVNAAIMAFEEGKPLLEALISANTAVMQICEWLGSPETGSTLLLAARSVTERDRIDLVWVGDSTAFLLHDGALSLLTEPDRLPDSNALVSAVGYLPEPAPRTAHARIARGDRVLLCTDGVWETLDPARLAELLSAGENAPWIAETITREAADRGGDNATALVLIAQNAEDDPRDAPDEKRTHDDLIARVPRVPCTPSYPASDYHDKGTLTQPPASIDEIVARYGFALEDDLALLDRIDID